MEFHLVVVLPLLIICVALMMVAVREFHAVKRSGEVRRQAEKEFVGRFIRNAQAMSDCRNSPHCSASELKKYEQLCEEQDQLVCEYVERLELCEVTKGGLYLAK